MEVKRAQSLAEGLRAQRALLARYLEEVEGWSQADIYRHLGISRALLVRIRSRYNKGTPAGMLSIRGDIPLRAKQTAAAVERAETDELQWIKVRDDAISATRESGVRPAEIARATGLTTARIAQLKTGSG